MTLTKPFLQIVAEHAWQFDCANTDIVARLSL